MAPPPNGPPWDVSPDLFRHIRVDRTAHQGHDDEDPDCRCSLCLYARLQRDDDVLREALSLILTGHPTQDPPPDDVCTCQTPQEHLQRVQESGGQSASLDPTTDPIPDRFCAPRREDLLTPEYHEGSTYPPEQVAALRQAISHLFATQGPAPRSQITPHRWDDATSTWTCLRCGEQHSDPCTCPCHQIEQHSPSAEQSTTEHEQHSEGWRSRVSPAIRRLVEGSPGLSSTQDTNTQEHTPSPSQHTPRSQEQHASKHAVGPGRSQIGLPPTQDTEHAVGVAPRSQEPVSSTLSHCGPSAPRTHTRPTRVFGTVAGLLFVAWEHRPAGLPALWLGEFRSTRGRPYVTRDGKQHPILAVQVGRDLPAVLEALEQAADGFSAPPPTKRTVRARQRRAAGLEKPRRSRRSGHGGPTEGPDHPPAA